MKEGWLVMWTKDGGKTWNPADTNMQFREKDAVKLAEKFAKATRGLYQYRPFKFSIEVLN